MRVLYVSADLTDLAVERRWVNEKYGNDIELYVSNFYDRARGLIQDGQIDLAVIDAALPEANRLALLINNRPSVILLSLSKGRVPEMGYLVKAIGSEIERMAQRHDTFLTSTRLVKLSRS